MSNTEIVLIAFIVLALIAIAGGASDDDNGTI